MHYLAFNYDDNDNNLIPMNYADLIQDDKIAELVGCQIYQALCT